ncbi:hypothetical protein [Pseudomonas graminis]
MYVRKDKPQENKTQSTAKSAVQSKAGGINSFEFVDNRTQPEQLKWLTGSVSEYSGLQLTTMEGNNDAVVNEHSEIQRKRNINEPDSHSKNHEVVQRIYKKDIKKGEENTYFEVIKHIAEGAAGAIYSAKLVPEVYDDLIQRDDIEGLPINTNELIAVKHVNGNALGEDKIDREENVPLEATLPGILTKQHRKRVDNEFAKIAPDTFGVLVVKDPSREGVIKEYFIMMELAKKGSLREVTPKGLTKFDDAFNENAKAYFNNLNAALITLEESDYTSGDIKGANTLVSPTVKNGEDKGVTTIGTGENKEDVTAVLADFGDYKKGPYRSRKDDLTNIMNNMFADTTVNKNFEKITAWSVSDKLWHEKPTDAE